MEQIFQKSSIWAVLRHLSSGLVVIGIMWSIGKPHAEDLIRKTVDERITKIERNQQQVQDAVRGLQTQQLTAQSDLGSIKDAQRRQDSKLDEVNKNLIELLRGMKQ